MQRSRGRNSIRHLHPAFDLLSARQEDHHPNGRRTRRPPASKNGSPGPRNHLSKNMKTRFALNCTIFAALAGLAPLGASAQSNTPSLKDVYADSFMIGTAISTGQATGNPGRRGQELNDKDIALAKAQFNQIAPENDLKWGQIQPRPGPDGYNWGPADAYVNFGLSNHMYIVGHNLVWHSQTPN